MNSSKVIVILFAALGMFFSSCEKNEILENDSPVQRDSDPVFCGDPTIMNLLADGYILAGDVTVNNDASNLYITVNSAAGWSINEIHLYVGDNNSLPLTNANEPDVASYPYNVVCNPNITTYTFIIPLSELNSCFSVSAFTILNNDDNATTHGAWSQGTMINSEVAGTYFEVCSQECESENEPEGEGCSMSQGYWFASPVAVWPSSGVTVAGFSYTEAEAKAIWNTSNANGIPDSKRAFTQVATIYLSGSTVSSTASVWNEIAICEAWLSTLGKLSPSNLPTGNNAVAVAAGNIGDWVDENHCQ